MTMDDQDREFGGTSSTVISDPVDAVLERLNSKSNQTVYETIIEIKNLIIGNNKYKSIYLKEKLVRRLLTLINDYYLNHLIGVINQNPSSQQQQQQSQQHHHQKSPTPPGTTSLGGVVNIDAQLVDVINQILTILSSFALGNLDHCVQLINNYRLHDMLFNLIRLARIYYTELAKASGDCDSAVSNEESLNGNLKLIESSLRCLSNLYSSAQMAPSLIVALDAHLYVYDVGTKQAVNMESLLKLYQLSRPSSTPSSSSKCRSSHSGLNSGSINLIRQYILNIFSISASNCMYVSRDENLSEARNWRALIIKSDLVRLFAGLLTNLNARVQLACLKFYHAITFECIEAVRVIMTTTYYDCALLDLISAYLSRENSAELQLYAAKCITNLFRSSMAYQQQPQQQREASLEATLSVLTSNHVLIKFKTLPTLIRLASTYSAIYRGHVSSAASSALSYFYTNHLLSCALANSTRPSGGGSGGQGASNGTSSDSSNRAKLVKLFGSLVLVDALATLTYLMESCADLQHTAAYLEQIIPALVANVSAGFNSLRFAGGNGVPSTGSLRPIYGRCSLKPSTHINEIKQCVKSWPSQSQSSHHHQHHYYHHHPRTLYSLTYVYYCHFASSAIHGKLNEHQYNFVGSASLGLDAHYQQQHKGNRGKTPTLHPLFMRTARFLTSLDSDLLHSRVVAASLQALAALALNSEESRRAIGGDTGTSVGGVGVGTAGSDLVARLIELIEADVAASSTIDHDDDDDDDDIDDIDDIIETDFDEEMIVGENEGGEGNGDEIQPSTLRRSAHQQRRILADATLLKLSALSLLHSLSRSVHQLRTKFLDIKLTNSVSYLIRRVKMQKDALNEQINSNSKRASATGKCREPSGDSAAQQLKNEPESEAMQQDNQPTQIDTELMISDEASGSGNDANGPKTDDYNRIDFSTNEQTFISLLLAILANMLIDFSPCKETLINNDIIKTLIEFVDFKNNTSIRVNSMWALMNLAYQSEQKVKQKILSEITIEKLFQLLTEQDETLILKTLGLIRNLICYRSHIDSMMSSYGNKIVQAIVMILEGEYYNYALKEQALCILANIADGSTSKTFIMENEDLLRKINSFMTHTQTELQVAAVYCVLNLVNTNDEGAYERQLKLKEIGAHRILQKLLHSSDPVLFDKVKNALQQFSTNLNNNHNSAASLLASSQSSNT